MRFRVEGGVGPWFQSGIFILYLSKLRGQCCFYLVMDNGFQAFDVVPAEKLLCIWFAVLVCKILVVGFLVLGLLSSVFVFRVVLSH